MEETDLSKCKVCGKIKVRKHVGSFDGTNKKFVGDDGRLWNGRTCPTCHKNKVKKQIKEKRNANTRNDS